MSNLGQLYFKLKEQAEFYGMDLDFETLEFIPKQPPVKETWLDKWLDKQAESDYTVYDNGN